MRQADIFLQSEGDAWLERNRGPRLVDPVAEAIERLEIKPQRVLEVGCSDGWRLAALRDRYRCEIMGVEPSMLACVEAANHRVPVIQSSAAVLPVSGTFDLVIYGFCLYLTDPADWFRIAAECDCVLSTGGYVIIHDFADVADPYAKNYEHRDGLRSYHVDFARLWLSHPLYSLTIARTSGDEKVSVIRKQPLSAIEVRR